jgi:hypothetical protein
MLLRHCLVWGEPYGSSGPIARLTQPLRRFTPEWPARTLFVTNPHWEDRLSEQWAANLYPPVTALLAAHTNSSTAPASAVPLRSFL